MERAQHALVFSVKFGKPGIGAKPQNNMVMLGTNPKHPPKIETLKIACAVQKYIRITVK